MDLKLADKYKAEIFGFAPEDTTMADALERLAQDHPRWTDDERKRHLDEAIASGAFVAVKSETSDKAQPHSARTQKVTGG